MKKFICLFFLCIMAISCENTVIEEEKTVTTRGTTSITPEQFASANSIFYDIKPIQGGIAFGEGLTQMSGVINTFEEGVEYDFIFFCKIRGTIRCSIYASGAKMVYNGRVYQSGDPIYGINGEQMKIKVKFFTNRTFFRLEVMGPHYTSLYSDVSARFVIDRVRYNGEYVGAPGYYVEHESSHDLTVNARFKPTQSPTLEWYWICSYCGLQNITDDWYCRYCHK